MLFESLDSYPEGRRRNLFRRHKSQIDFRRGLDGTRGIRDLLTPTTLALSVGRRVSDSDLGSVGRAIARMPVFGLWGRQSFRAGGVGSFDSTIRLFFEGR